MLQPDYNREKCDISMADSANMGNSTVSRNFSQQAHAIPNHLLRQQIQERVLVLFPGQSAIAANPAVQAMVPPASADLRCPIHSI
jgi:hypothetical protein